MKIALLTLPLHSNYGGIVQAYALMSILRKMGHDVTLINRQNRTKTWKRPLKFFLNTFSSGHLNYNVTEPSKEIFNFIKEFIHPQTPFINSLNQLKKLNNNGFDAFIVGSDQVWRANYSSTIEDYFFGFLDKKNLAKKISYAASFGIDNWEFSSIDKWRCKRLVKKFHAVSVREDSAVELCKKHFGITAEHVLDPTMLLTTSDYNRLVPNGKQYGELMVYILDGEEPKNNLTDMLMRHYGYKPFYIKAKAACGEINSDNEVPASVENWLKGFHDAKFIVTDSFHGCVFSILFNKPFLVYANKKRGVTRFISLLKTFNLEDRVIHSLSDVNNRLIEQKIDWLKVNEILTQKREISLEFLTNALK
jgi:polysaccharide pyruvyl transferase WcaK-like protein